MPPELATVEWICLAPAEFGVHLPYYGNLVMSAYEKCYSPDTGSYNTTNPDENSMYWVFRRLYSQCAATTQTDRLRYGDGIRAFWERYQKSLIEQQSIIDEYMVTILKTQGRAAAEAKATQLSKSVAEQTYGYAKQILAELTAFRAANTAGNFVPSISAVPIYAPETEFYSSFETTDAAINPVVVSSSGNNFATTVGAGPAQLWGNVSTRANLGWTGSRALKISGTKQAESASYYATIYDNLNILIGADTRLSYMVLPYIDADTKTSFTSANNAGVYDAEYTCNYAAIDLKFDDGTFLRTYGAIDQYGFKVSPLDQGNAGIIEQNNWLKVTSKLGDVAALRGKTITSILVGYEKPTGSTGKSMTVFFDDVQIYREPDPVVENLAEYVNILRGTQNGAYDTDHNKYAHGLNNPIVSTPYPFNFWSPGTTMSAQTIYQYTGSQANFKHIHLNHVASNWIGESGNFDFSADSTTVWSTAAALYTSLNSRGSNFKHENEIAHAHYYGVTFNEDDAKAPGVKIEVTPTEHAAVLRFTFPAGSTRRNVILDSAKARNATTSGITYNDDGTFAAFTSRTNNGQKRMYVYGQFSVVPSAFRQAASNYYPMSMFEFDAAANGPTVVELKVATSFISAAQAIKNLNLEIAPTDNFDSIEAKALAQWNEKLGCITVEDPNATYDQLVSLYSNLYRACIYPLLDSENTGTNEAPRWQYASPYSGNATTITLKDGRLFYNNGFWDTFRTAWPTLALLTPIKDADIVNGLVAHYLDNTWVPRWIAPAGTNSMVGTNSDSIFGDAIAQGIVFDYANAYASSLKNATVYSPNNSGNFYSGRAGMAEWPFLGYTPTGSLTDENLSWSLESCPADFGIATMAKALRDKETPGTEAYRKLNDEYIYFINRAQNYVNLFNPAIGGWFRGKTSAGTWLWPDSQFNPVAFGYGYCEDNAWNYAFHAQHDGRGLANLYGGQDKLGDKLDADFSADPNILFGNWSGYHKEKVECRGSKLGQVHMSNEPAFHIPYMYLFSDRPWRTADVVRDILDRHFAGSDIGQGYIGDDDNGAMSSWYVISALGLYPLSGGNGEFVIGTPLFEKVTIKRDNGETFTITAPGISRENRYVQSAKVNNVARTKPYIAPADIRDGATIELTMGSVPSPTWGVGVDAQPPSITQDDFVPVPLHDLTTAITPSTTAIPSGFADGAYTTATNPAYLFNNTSANNASFAAGSGSKVIYYYFYKGATIDMYTITSSTAATAPAGWTLSGSIDGDAYTTLDVRTGQSFAWDRYTRPFAIENPGRYKYYKIEFTGTSAINIAQFELMGGAYATANKEALYELILRARSIDGSIYVEETYLPLVSALALAEGVYANEAATIQSIGDAMSVLEKALDGLRMPPRTECDVVDVNAPLAVNGTSITGTVSNHTTSLDLSNMIRVSDKATWTMYSNPGYTTVVANKSIAPLSSGNNVRYIRVTAEDGISVKDYVLTVYRMTSHAGSFAAAPSMLAGTLDPAVWGEKLFTLGAGLEGSPLRTFTGRAGYPPATFKADVYMRYDAQNLYLGLIVNDPLWTAAPSGNIWRGCGIQLDIWSPRPASGANNDATRAEYGFALTGPTAKTHSQFNTATGRTGLTANFDNYSITRVGTTDTYIYTIGIPLSSFRQNAATNPLTAGEEIWFAIAYNWPDTSSNMACAYDMGFHDKNPNEARSITLGLPQDEIIKADINSGVVESVTINVNSPGDAVLMLAAYDGIGKMIKVQSFEPASAALQQAVATKFDISGAATVKAFLWNKDTMIPLAEAKVISNK
jgi:predicted alpha-1,2-mannosidase